MATKGNGKVTETSIPLNVTLIEGDEEVVILVRSKTQDLEGRTWETTASGKGATVESAIDGLHADIAKKPMQIAGIIRRMLETSKPDSSEPDAPAKIGTKAQQAEMKEAKELKELVKIHGLKIKFPFGATRAVRRQMIMEAIDAKGGKKKEAF